VDEVFLTVSPLIAGRGSASERLGLVERFEALPGERLGARLLSVRSDGAHLFLRYESKRRHGHATSSIDCQKRWRRKHRRYAPLGRR
jgi:hypothetical protein